MLFFNIMVPLGLLDSYYFVQYEINFLAVFQGFHFNSLYGNICFDCTLMFYMVSVFDLWGHQDGQVASSSANISSEPHLIVVSKSHHHANLSICQQN